MVKVLVLAVGADKSRSTEGEVAHEAHAFGVDGSSGYGGDTGDYGCPGFGAERL